MDILTLELYFYSLQQIINNFLIEKLNNITVISGFTIFFGGVLTSFNPCMLSSIPIVITYINKQSQKNLYSAVFLLGIISSLVFISLLTLLAQTSFTLSLSTIPILKPLITICIGLSLLNIVSFRLPSFFEQTSQSKSILSVLESYICGLSIGFNLSSCSTPVLMTVITWVTYTNQALVGAILLFIYAVGYISPIIISIISINQFKRIRMLSLVLYKLMPFTGCLVVSIGSFSLWSILLT